MTKKLFIFILSVLTALSVHAGVLEQLEQVKQQRLQNEKSENATTAVPKRAAEIKKEKRYMTLSNGKRMDISDWQIVHFMSSTCSYCQQFNPKLKQVSEQTGIPVTVFSFDNKGDQFFPNVLNANEDVLRQFFAELPRATPTDFLVNNNNLITLPLTQGDVSTYTFVQRIDEVLLYVDKNLRDVINAK